MAKKVLCSILICATLFSGAQTQTMDEIKQQKQAAQKEIKETSRKISQNKNKTKKSLNSLNRITADIKTQQASIDNLNKQIAEINIKSDIVGKTIENNNKELARLQENYLKAIKKIRSHRSPNNSLSFLLSSESFHQAYRRMRYLKEFSQWRERQSGEIKAIQAKLMQEKKQLMKLQEEKNRSIATINKTKLSLETKKTEQNRIVASLKAEGEELQQVLRDKEKEAQALDRRLNQLIEEEERKAAERARIEAEKRKAEEAERARKEEEARRAEEERIRKEKEQQELQMKKLKEEQEKRNKKAEKKRQEELKKKQREIEKRQEELRKQEEQLKKEREAAKKKEEENNKARYTMDNEEFKLSGSFESNKGKLPCPVAGKYSIVRSFGRQKHPELKYVETDNPGIDIEAGLGAEARAVFDGKVSAIFQQPGYNNIVMVRHGNYLTIYAGLTSIYVKTGDTLKMGQPIGKIFSDIEDENRTLLHFEIRKEREKLNPELWLKK